MRAKSGLVAALAAMGLWACGGGSGSGRIGSPNNDGGTADGGDHPDGGNDAGETDGGTTDGGATDAGADDGGVDAGPDAGTDGGVAITVPDSAGWTFLTANDGLASTQVQGASVDEGGNLWVAGGTSGVFVQRKGSTHFEQFGLADGLHPYGYMADGTPADTDPHLEALSVAGGKAGVAFVGYNGKEPASHLDKDRCEDNWDSGSEDPTIYKSGDADKVTLTDTGIAVAHYDISSGLNMVPAEPRGREKLCNIFRILYEHGTNNVWFGANHGFAWGDANFNGNPTCAGQRRCSGVLEHVHPMVNDSKGNGLTGDYRGVSLDLLAGHEHNVWFGGIHRTTLFKFGDSRSDFFTAQPLTENDLSNQFDVWPDAVEVNPRPDQLVRDDVSGIAALPDGSAYIASFDFGVRHIARDGTNLGDLRLVTGHAQAIARDPEDGSIWVGYGGFDAGVGQIMPDGTMRNYGKDALGGMAKMTVKDIQIDTFTKTVDPSVKHNRVIISMQCALDGACNFSSGAVAIHVTPDPPVNPTP